jgi:phage gp29-like protein
MAKPPKVASSNRRTVGKTLEVATRQRSIDFAYFGGHLPNPDTVLKKMGKDLTVYDELMGDAHLGSVISSRKSGVKSLLWEVDRGKAKSRQAKAITEHLATMPIHAIISEILDAPLKGYQPLEIIWGEVGGYIMPLRVVGKPPEWFLFTEDNELRWRSQTAPLKGEELPPRKFLLPRHNATYKNPYGEPLLSRCFWPVTFKRSGIKFWITFAEKFGMPWPVAKLPRSSPEAHYTTMLENLEKMVQDALAAIPDDSSIEFLESGSKGASADIYKELIAWANSEISKAIVGHGAAADSTPGKLGGEDNALQVRGDLIDEDRIMVEEVFNQLIQWTFEINFGGGIAPKFSMFAEEDVDQEQANRDKTLSDQGVRLSQAYYEREYGFQPGDIVKVEAPGGAAPAAPGEPAEFAERRPGVTDDQAAVDKGIEKATRAEDLRRETGFVQQILDVFTQSGDYSEAMEKAIGLYPDMEIGALQKKIESAIFVNGIVGRLTGKE